MRVQLIRYHDIANINTRLADSLNRRQGVLQPLGLAYLASALEKSGYEVNIIDAVAEALSVDEVRQRIRSFKPRVVGVTAMTPSVHGALQAAKLAKEEGAITVIGGVHMALFAQETLAYDFIDYGLVGEAEESLVELCNAIERDSGVLEVEGLVYRNNGQVVTGKPRLINNLDNLSFPAFHLLPMKRYSSIIGLYPVANVMGSRGCPYKCHFCYKTPSDSACRTRSARNIVDEMELLVNKYKVKEIMFYDDVMLPANVEQLCLELLKRNFKVAWETPQRVNLVNPELLALMKKAGCRQLRYGVEQGDPGMMAFIDKRIDIEQVKKVFRWTKEAGIDTFAYFIIGYIQETKETMRSTIDLAKELNPHFVMFTKAVPLPETPLYDMAVREGFINVNYWRDFTLGKIIRPISPFVADVEIWLKKAYREFYLRPSKIFEQLISIRSLNDVRNSLKALVGLLAFKSKPAAVKSEGGKMECKDRGLESGLV